MHCHCGTNNRAQLWTFTEPCKPEAIKWLSISDPSFYGINCLESTAHTFFVRDSVVNATITVFYVVLMPLDMTGITESLLLEYVPKWLMQLII